MDSSMSGRYDVLVDGQLVGQVEIQKFIAGQRAIAFKLDEISEKLDKRSSLIKREDLSPKGKIHYDEIFGWGCVKRASDGFCQEEKRWKKDEVDTD